MKYKAGEKYLYKEFNIILTFNYEEKDIYFNCDNCDREIKHLFFFTDEDGSNYKFGSECVKKAITKIK